MARRQTGKSSPATLKEMLAKRAVDRLTDDRSHERGEQYFKHGQVETLTQYGQRLSAVVRGTFPYKAAIWLEDGALHYSCSCPAGGFCKHLVAVALAFRAGQAEVLGDAGEDAPPTRVERKGKKSPDLRTHLMTQSKERLVGWLLEQAARDDALHERLKLDAATANPAGVNLDDFRRRIDKGLDFPEVSYDYDRYAYDEDEDSDPATERFNPVMHALEKIFAQGHATAAASLVEYALTEFEKVAARLEHDSDSMDDIMHRLCALHRQAIAQTRPDPLTLAEWVFNRSLAAAAAHATFPWKDYRPALGAKGVAHFRSRAEAAWEKLPVKTAGDRYYDASNERRFLKEVMVHFAEIDGDVDARAAVERKDLSSPEHYLELARIYQKAKRYDEALSWAEKGWNAFPDRHGRHDGLRTFLAAEYRRRRRLDDAMALYWSEFERDSSLYTYLELRKQADLDRAWPLWREKAIARLREAVEAERLKAEAKKAARPGGSLWPNEVADRSRLVEIFLWERNPEAAWREAVAGGCSEELWLKLSKEREKQFPADCIPIWRRRVERLTRNADQSNYAPAAESLKKLGQLLERTGQAKAFTTLMAEIRLTRRARRNFIAELDRKKLP